MEGACVLHETALGLEPETLSTTRSQQCKYSSSSKVLTSVMAELETQDGQETDKMLDGDQGDDDDLKALEFVPLGEPSRPVQLDADL